IGADGRFEYSGLMQSTLYNCTTRLFNHKVGTARVSGQTVTLVPSQNQWTSENTCSSRRDKKEGAHDAETYEWRLDRDDHGVKLCLQNAKMNFCVYRQ